MNHLNHKRTHSILLACCLLAGVAGAHAQDTPETATTSTTTSTSTTSSTTTAVGTSTNTESKLSAEFANFLGGEDQASAVVSGLRQGTAFSLETETTTTGSNGTTTTTTTTIDPPTGTMGYGNIRIALRLAQAQLNDLGITQPTADQLSAVLVGGTIDGTPVDGILTLRADGMGWGQIARQYGTTVGQLMGQGGVHANVHASQTPPPLQSKSAGRTTTAAGSTGKVTSPPKAHANGYIPSGKGLGGGFVTAAGNTVSASGMGGGRGQTHQPSVNAHGAGVTSAGGQHVSMTGASNAGGGSSASAPGQAKRN